MDSVTVNGKLYKKASVLAKEFRYTTDYIGQLCRNKKVDCQFVGRSWYVTETSLLAHKDARYKEVRAGEKTIKDNALRAKATDEVSVRPRLLKTTQKVAIRSHFATRLIPRESKYFTDEADLLPMAKKPVSRITPTIPTIVPVTLEAATTIKVKAENIQKKLVFTDLPAVALAGNLTVHEVLPDSTPSTPVVLPATPTVEPMTPPVTSLKARVQTPVKATHIDYTPTIVKVQTKTHPTGLLVVLALIMGCLFFVFFTLTANVFVISKNATTVRVIFDPTPLKFFLQDVV